MYEITRGLRHEVQESSLPTAGETYTPHPCQMVGQGLGVAGLKGVWRRRWSRQPVARSYTQLTSQAKVPKAAQGDGSVSLGSGDT